MAGDLVGLKAYSRVARTVETKRVGSLGVAFLPLASGLTSLEHRSARQRVVWTAVLRAACWALMKAACSVAKTAAKRAGTTADTSVSWMAESTDALMAELMDASMAEMRDDYLDVELAGL